MENWAELLSTPDNPVTAYNVRVGLIDILHPDDRSFFNQIPTSFSLSEEQVDRLIEAGRELLRNNPNYQRLLEDLGGVQTL
jgi:NTE family protein